MRVISSARRSLVLSSSTRLRCSKISASSFCFDSRIASASGAPHGGREPAKELFREAALLVDGEAEAEPELGIEGSTLRVARS
jgi:hypothetical protein